MIEIQFTDKDNNVISIPANKIAETFGIEAKDPDYPIVKVKEKTGELIVWATGDLDSDYPGVYVDGRVNGQEYLISSIDLPNEECNAIINKVYAGNTKLEVDDWIACVPLGDRYEGDESRRVIFVDRNQAKASRLPDGWNWNKIGHITTEDTEEFVVVHGWPDEENKE